MTPGSETRNSLLIYNTIMNYFSDYPSDEELLYHLNQIVERQLAYSLSLTSENPLGLDYIKSIYTERDAVNLVSKGHLFIENFLDELIRRKFKHPKVLLKNPCVNFSLKLDILRAKSYLSKRLHHDIRLLDIIMNKLAKNLTYDISKFDMSKFCYCGRIKECLKDRSKETKRRVNLYILKIIFHFLFYRINKKHPFIADSEIQCQIL